MTESKYVVSFNGEHQKVPVKGWARGVEFDDNTVNQLKNIAALPFIHKHVAAMPDAHLGKGSTVGSVIATKKAIIPAAVGVDIGCGMMACRTSLSASDLPDNLAKLRSQIEMNVPHGNGARGSWRALPPYIGKQFTTFDADKSSETSLALRFTRLYEKFPKIEPEHNPVFQLGTLGGGNHFLEVCLDEAQRVWIMLHSGSRNIGKRIGEFFIGKAKEEMARWHITLPDEDLAYLPEGSQYFEDYCQNVALAQEYAMTNRRIMMDFAIASIGMVIDKPFTTDEMAVNCHHNYISREAHFGANVWVTRKGAVRAREGDLGIIPGSMGAKSFIVRGKGSVDSFHSCSHGAGRRMSRGKAEELITLEEHQKALAGVECRADKSTIDESPAAYKDIDAVMAAQSDLVEIVHTLKQVLCVKG